MEHWSLIFRIHDLLRAIDKLKVSPDIGCLHSRLALIDELNGLKARVEDRGVSSGGAPDSTK